MSSYPPQFIYFLQRIGGYSTNHFRLEPQSGETYSSGRLIRFTLPSNALLNMRSFAMHFNAATAGGTRARLPAKIDSLIERVEVSAGGIQLSQGLNFYNVLRHAKDAITGNKCSAAQMHPEIVRERSYVDGSNITAGGETYNAVGKDTLFCINHWEGFLGTCEPRIIDTSLLPDLVVTVYLTTNHVLSDSRGTNMEANAADGFYRDPAASAATFTLSNVHATIECIGLADAVYDNMNASEIAAKGFLEVPFKQYFSFSNEHTGSTRFTVATQSLDRIWLAMRGPSHNDRIHAPHPVKGYLTGAACIADTNLGRNIVQVGTSSYGGLFDTNKEKAVGYYYRFQEPIANGDAGGWEPGDPHTTVSPSYQLQLNGAYFPQFSASAEQMFEITRNSVPYNSMPNMSLQQYKDSFFVQCARFNMQDSELARLITGLDTRSVSLNGYFNTMNVANIPNLCIFVECSSTLRIGSGRQLEVIT